MRSRYTAFAVKDADYLFATYSTKARKKQSKSRIEKSMAGVEWQKLEILAIHEGRSQHDSGEVEFVAHYVKGNRRFTLRERSLFIREKWKWRYLKACQ